jgi:guanylate kinase
MNDYGSQRSSERVQTIVNTTCHLIESEEESSLDVVKKFTCSKNSNANTRLLLEIAISTFSLAKKNREIQERLKELKTDTKKLIESVLENPENESVRDQLQFVI